MVSLTYTYFKESSAFYVWQFKEQNIISNLYIEKYRVPKPVPRALELKITFDRRKPPSSFNDELTDPIIVNVGKVCEHTNNIRYDCFDYYNPIRSVYIPSTVLADHPNASKLQITVKWYMNYSSHLNQLKINFLCNYLTDSRMPDILDIFYDIKSDEFLIWYQDGNGNHHTTVYRVIELQGDISGVRFVAYHIRDIES